MKGFTTDSLAVIVIPVHNRMHLTLACLDRLAWSATENDWKILVVDDGSTDGTGPAVRECHSHVELVAGDGELYWTGAIVKGMRRAIELGASEIVWLNDDTLPNEASLRRIIEHVRRNPRHILASCAWNGGRPAPTGSLRRHPVLPAPGELARADVVAGYQVAFSILVIQVIGFPDPQRWPHYAGDSGFTRDAHNAGFQLLVDGGSRIDLCDPPGPPGIAETFWRGDASLSARIRCTFFMKNSRYRLSSRWHLDRLYRGLTAAAFVFPARCAVWLASILFHRGKARNACVALAGPANSDRPSQ